MKARLLLILLLLLPWVAPAQTVIKSESFETDGENLAGRYTSNTFNGGTSGTAAVIANQYFLRAAASAPPANWSINPVSGGNLDGSSFWASEGARGPAGIFDRSPGTVTLDPATVTGYSSLKVRVAFMDARASTPGWEFNDTVKVQVRFNGTTAWTTVGQFAGSSSFTQGSLRQDQNLNGKGYDDTPDAAHPDLTATLTDYEFAVTGTGTTLQVRVVVSQDGVQEELGFDNIRILGTQATSAAPVLGGIETTSLPYAEGDAPRTITSTLTLTDADSPNLSGATVTLTSPGYVNGQDVLAFINQNGITGTWDAAAGTLTLGGASSVANYLTALTSITYQNTNTTNATAGNRTVSFSAKDQANVSSNTVSRVIAVTSALLGAASIPYSEDFENDGEGTLYASNTFNAVNGLAFLRTNLNPFNSGAATFTGVSGNYRWDGSGTNTASNPDTRRIGILETRQVDATNHIALHFQVKLGARQNEWESTDYLKLYYRTGGIAGTWTIFASFRGNLAAGGGNLTQDANPADLTSLPAGAQLSTALTNFDFALPAALNGQQVDFRFELSTNDSREEAAWDLVQVTGTLVVPPTVATTAAGTVATTSATLGGTVTADGGATLTERGVVYVVGTGTPTTGDTKALVATSGIVVGTAFSGTVSGLTAGTPYAARAYAINKAGTSYGSVVAFTTLAPLTVSPVSQTNVACFGSSTGSATVSVSGGVAPYTYAWSPSGGTSATASGLAAGTYTVTVTDANAATTTRSFTITQPTSAVGGTTVVTNVACNGGSNGRINLTPSSGVGPYTYLWDTGQTTEDRVGLTAGTYSVTVTDVNGCTGTVSNITVTQPASAVGGTTVVTNVACNGGSNGAINLTPSGGVAPYYFLWNTGQTTEDRVGLTAGTYSVTVTDVNGCTGTVSNITVTQPPVLAATTSQNDVTAYGGNDGSATLTVSGGTPGYTYAWSPSVSTAATASNLSAGTYTVTATDANGCTLTRSFTITQPVTATVVSVTRLTPSPTATASVLYQVVFSTPVTGVGLANFSVTGSTGGALTGVSGSGTTYTVAVNTGTGTGSLLLNVANGTGVLPAVTNVPYTGGSPYTVIKDFPAQPQLTIQGTGGPAGGGDVTAFVDAVQVLRSNVPFANALQNGSFESHDPLGNGGFGYNPTGANWTFNARSGIAESGSAIAPVTPLPDGIAVALVQSTAGSNGQLQQHLALPTGTNYQVSFQAAQRGCCTTADQALNVLLNGVFVGSIQPAGTTSYSTFTSAAFNVAAPALTAGISSAAGASGSTTSTSPISFTITFSEAVTGFTASDVTVGNGALSGFSGSGSAYTFTVTPAANGAVTVNVPASGAFDANNTGNTAASPFSITYVQPVTAAPATTVPANGSLTSTPTPTYAGTAVASSTVASSTVTVYVDGTAIGTTTATDGGDWTLTQPTALADGSHTVYATAQTSGSAMSANSTTNTFTVDTVRPTVAISSTAGTSGSTTLTSPIPYTVTFSERVTGFVTGDVSVTNGTLAAFAGSGTTYTFTVTPTTAGTATTVNVPANVAQDAAGNGNTAALPFTMTYAPVPTLTSLSPTSGVEGTSVTLTGTNLNGATSVSFNGTAQTTLTTNTATSVTAAVPPGATTGNVRVTTPNGTSNGVSFTVTHAPVATAQPVSTAEDVAKDITLAGTDQDGDALTYGIATAPAHGTLTGTGAARTYTPAANYNGPDSFTFTATDGTLTSGPATVSITVTAVNDAPTANAQRVSTAEDVAKAITLAGTDPDGDALTYAIATQPAHGTLTGTGADRTYTPVADYNGSDSFTFTASDGTLTSAAATVSITVTAVNDAPTVTAQRVTTDEDVAKDITLAGTDQEGDALTYAIATAPAHGTLTAKGAVWTYTPNPNYNGPDFFTFTATDGTLTSGPATVSITVTAVNDRPVLANVPAAANIAKQVLYTFTAIATDADGDRLTFSLVAPSAGDVIPAGAAINASTGVFTWTPTAAQAGSTYAFSVSVSDELLLTDSKPVALTVLKGTTTPAAPTIASINPPSGPVGIEVTISGTNLTSTTSVLFASLAPSGKVAATFKIQPDGSVKATVPPGATNGKISLTTPDGTAQSPNNFTIVTKPVIDSFSPTSGPGRTLVTITGYNLLNPTKVVIGSKSTTITLTVDKNRSTDRTLYATLPPTAPVGTSGPISVTTVNGTGTSTGVFTVTAPAARELAAGPVLEQPLQASPNPFQGRVLLRFALAREQAYALRVYDVRGALVQELGTGTAKGGEARELEWDARHLAEGLYLVRLTTATRTQTLRLVRQP